MSQQQQNKSKQKTLTIPKKYQTATQPALANALDLSHCAALLRSDPFNRKPASESLSLKSWNRKYENTEIWKSKPNKYDGRTSWLCYHIFSHPGQPLFARVAWRVSELGKSGETVFCVGNWWPSDVSMMVYHDTLWWSDMVWLWYDGLIWYHWYGGGMMVWWANCRTAWPWFLAPHHTPHRRSFLCNFNSTRAQVSHFWRNRYHAD